MADAVARIAADRGLTSSQIALNWVMNRSGVTSTLVGVETTAQLDEQIAALDIQLTPAETHELDRLYTPSDVINDHNVNRIPRMARPPLTPHEVQT